MAATSDAVGNGRVSAAVRVNGEIRSIPTDFPPRAVFPIYSITKTLTAICVLRLVETGALRLGDAARRWLPDDHFCDSHHPLCRGALAFTTRLTAEVLASEP